jgi:hypothetical protein
MAEKSHAFLLRGWQEPDVDGKPAWRFSLTYINTKREKRGFTSLESVFAYLLAFFNSTNRHISGGKQP